jgi:hypothetical protein
MLLRKKEKLVSFGNKAYDSKCAHCAHPEQQRRSEAHYSHSFEGVIEGLGFSCDALSTMPLLFLKLSNASFLALLRLLYVHSTDIRLRRREPLCSIALCCSRDGEVLDP